MSADAANQPAQTEAAPVAKEAPTEQQLSQAGVPKKITNAQTVCNEKNQKGKLCNGHLKQMKTGGEEAEKHLRGDDVLFQCQTCGTLYMGPPLGHVRDPEKQARFVEKELTAILRAAGGTLPAFKKSERGTLVPLEEETSHHAPAAAATPAAKPAAAAKPATTATAKPASNAPANETPEERKARLIAEAQARKAAGGATPKPAAAAKPSAPSASTSGTDSSAEADRHRPAAEAQAATGQASAAPMSSAASTASPAAGAETVSDLAPEASTELTPGAPKDERNAAQKDSAAQDSSEESKTGEG